MRAAADAAWESNWAEAAEAYGEALAQSPESVDALTGLGMAYAQLGKHSEASAAYRRASELAPDDPVLLERVGKALEDLGRDEEACKAYLSCAEQYIEQQESPKLAVACWESAVRVQPGCVEAHVQLLKHYQRQGRIGEATQECLHLARIYGDQGRWDYGLRLCEHALKLSPRNSEALELRDSLRRGKRIAERKEPTGTGTQEPRAEEKEPVALPDADTLEFRAESDEQIEEETGSPVESTRRRALSELASSVFEEDAASATRAERLTKDAVDTMLSKAIDYQTRGKVDEAVAAYQRVLEAGADRPAVHFNLGLLYQETVRFEEAIEQFKGAVSHPDYKLGSHFALGECYRARGRVDEALEHFIEVLKIVDLATVEREHADDLINLYEHLTDGYLVKGDEDQALEFASSLVAFLNEQGWEDKVRHARRRLDTLTQEGPVVTLAEALTVPNSERILESIALSQEYLRRGMHYTAMEECHLAMESAPGYLPIHRQLAEVSREMGRVEEAVNKLGVIAGTYHVRGAARQAAAMYRQALKMAPMDTAVRGKLIDLLVSHGEIEQALRQYLILADSYQHLAQMDRAQEIYQEALRLVPRVDDEREWRVRVLHKVGDIAMRRVDWKKALSVYREIRDLSPGDERARLTLMELHYRLDQPRRALKELDELLSIYREEGRAERIFAVLSDLVSRWPDVVPIRARLAQAHLNAGNREEALEHLDRLGDMQLEVGQVEQAKATIRAIVALKPPNVEEYRRLLTQL
jgi:tetratricopeptide (TPR) repeat protein